MDIEGKREGGGGEDGTTHRLTRKRVEVRICREGGANNDAVFEGPPTFRQIVTKPRKSCGGATYPWLYNMNHSEKSTYTQEIINVQRVQLPE